MSQDIRNFFLRTTKGNEKKVEPENKKRNRKRIVLDSDSDEEPATKVKKIDDKKSPKGRSVKSKLPVKSPIKKKGSPTKPKLVEISRTSIVDLLGKQPIKRTEQPKIKLASKENKLEAEFGDDEDFQVAFQQLDEVEDGDWFVKKDEKNKRNKLNDSVGKSSSIQESNDQPKLSVKDVEKGIEEHHIPLKKQKLTPKEIDSKKEPNLNKLKKKNLDAENCSEENIYSKKKKDSPKKGDENEKMSSSYKFPSTGPTQDKHDQKNEKNKESNTSKSTNGLDKVHNKINQKEYGPKPHVENKDHEMSPSSSPKPRKVTLSDNFGKQEKFDLWVEKYKPTNLKQIIGQQGEKSNVNKLVKWLKDWNSNHNGSKKLARPSPWAKDDSGAYFKAALLSGSPGIGKTTTAHLVCKELNMDVVEFNASDTRSKKMLSDQISELLSTKSLSHYVNGCGGISRTHVLLMDEVDGMAGNEDRGGIQELINLIKNSKVPIICMCNDRNHPKIRSLVNYCFDLHFNKPRIDQIKGAMMSICFKENIKIKPETMIEIITSTNQDIRLILNYLSMLAAKGSDMEVAQKYIKLGPWDVLRKVFSEEELKKMTIHDKSDLFFHDYSIAPLFVHENYLLVIPHSQKSKSKLGKMELFSKAVSSLCNGDLMQYEIRKNNSWSLLPVQAMFSSVIPGDILKGHVGGKISFPAWFGKNSRRMKLDRLSRELQVHTRLKTSCSKEAMKLDYCRLLRDEISRPLVERGTEGISDTIAFLHGYDLLREDIESLTELNNWPPSQDPFASLESKIKAAFTRAYNKAPVVTPFSIVAPIKKTRGMGGGMEEEYGEEEALEEENRKDDITTDGMIMVKKKTEKKEEKKNEKKKVKKIDVKPKKGGKGRK